MERRQNISQTLTDAKQRGPDILLSFHIFCMVPSLLWVEDGGAPSVRVGPSPLHERASGSSWRPLSLQLRGIVPGGWFASRGQGNHLGVHKDGKVTLPLPNQEAVDIGGVGRRPGVALETVRLCALP